MGRGYEWTLDDVREAHRRAKMKRLEWAEACDTAQKMECEYWTRQLVKKFPGLEYNTHKAYLATIAYRNGNQECRVIGPIVSEYGVAQILVWHRGSKGKFHKTATCYQCDEIVPFITDVCWPTDAKESEA